MELAQRKEQRKERREKRKERATRERAKRYENFRFNAGENFDFETLRGVVDVGRQPYKKL